MTFVERLFTSEHRDSSIAASIRGFDSRPRLPVSLGFVGQQVLIPRAGSIDSLTPVSSPFGLRLCRSAAAGSIPAHR